MINSKRLSIRKVDRQKGKFYYCSANECMGVASKKEGDHLRDRTSDLVSRLLDTYNGNGRMDPDYTARVIQYRLIDVYRDVRAETNTNCSFYNYAVYWFRCTLSALGTGEKPRPIPGIPYPGDGEPLYLAKEAGYREPRITSENLRTAVTAFEEQADIILTGAKKEMLTGTKKSIEAGTQTIRSRLAEELMPLKEQINKLEEQEDNEY